VSNYTEGERYIGKQLKKIHQMKKKVIENFNEWIFEAETAAATSPSTLVAKAKEMFPKVEWYKNAANKQVAATDPEAVKAFKVVKRFFDPKVPELAMNQGKDFFEYYLEKGKKYTDKSASEQPIVASTNDIMSTKSLYDALVPVLMTSGFPQTKPFKAASEMASRTNPAVSKLLALPTVKPHVETLYQELTAKTA
jgi:hypothetical protein